MTSSERKNPLRCMVCKKYIDITTGYWGKVNTIGEQKYWHDSCNEEYDQFYSKKDN